MFEKFKRIKLGHFPTPIEHLKNISQFLGGPNIFIKRDDCTGLATGGNKTRKLEFLMPDAINKKAELVITIGAVQSNHARQTAAACTLLGLKCLIILEQRLNDPPESYMKSGNVFLDKLFGAEIVLCPKNENVLDYSQKIVQDLQLKGTNIYFIPGGGSNEIGALGYVGCLDEIIKENSKYNFTQIILVDPNWSEAWNKRATVLYLLGRYQQSQKDIDEVLKLEKRHFGALSGQGLVQTELKNYEKAVNSYIEVQKIYPAMQAPKVMIPRLKELIKGQST